MPILARHNPVTGPGAGPRLPANSYASWHRQPLLTSISQTMPAHRVGEQHGAKTAPNKQLGLSYPATECRIQDC